MSTASQSARSASARPPGSPARSDDPPQDPLELRVMPRVGNDLPAQIYSSDFTGALPARTRDLSVGGACVATPSPFAIKSLYAIEIDLPGGRVRLECEGRWQREEPAEGVILSGCQFATPPPEAGDLLWDAVIDAGKQLARFLHEYGDLDELGLEDAMGLAQISRWRSVKAGDYIYQQGRNEIGDDSVFLVREGQVVVQLRVNDALETEIERLGPGRLFGGLPLLSGSAHADSAIAASDVRLLEIDRPSFEYIRAAKPWLGQRLGSAVLRVSAERLQQTLRALAKRR